jgi:general secretion pathway protein N
MRRALLAFCALMVALVWQAPAAIFDQYIDHSSGGTLRLAQAHGTVWSGQGILMTSSRSPGVWQPQLPLEWTLDAPSIADRLLAWKVSSGGASVTTIGIGFDGVVASRVHLRGPASLFLERFKHNFARAGWRGDISIQSTRFQCAWNGHCAGRMELDWTNAASDLLPGQQLGTYRLVTDGIPGEKLRFQLRTLGGAVRIDGEGGWGVDGSVSFNGTTRGPPELLQRLPSIAGPWVRPTDEAGTWAIAISIGSESPRQQN